MHHWRRQFIIVLATAAGLTLAADWLFYQQPIGWTLGLFTLALTIVLLCNHGRAAFKRPTWLLSLALVGLGASMIESPGPLNLILAGVGVMTLALTLRIGWSAKVSDWLQRWVLLIVCGWTQPFRDLHQIHRRHTHKEKTNIRRPVGAAQWVIPIVLSLIFVALFSLANPVISNWVSRAGQWGMRLPEYVEAPRVIFWLITGAAIWALLRYRVRIKRRSGVVNPWSAAPDVGQMLVSPTFIVRCLILFNLVFAVQTVLDLYYLTGGTIVPDGLTLKSYTRRGAYPLVATALLAAGFVLTTFRPGVDQTNMQWARRLVYLWLAQNVMLLISACWRLNLYIHIDQLTRLRIAAAIWMLLVLLGLIYIFVRILTHRDNHWLVHINIMTLTAVLYVCCFVNFDGLIAEFNVRRYIAEPKQTEREHLDYDYLAHLGPEALPALRFLDEHIQTSLDDRREWMTRRIDKIERKHIAQLNHQMRDWRGWTWRRHRLRQFMGQSDHIPAPTP